MRENLIAQQIEKASIYNNENKVDRQIVEQLAKANSDAIEAEKQKRHEYRVKLQKINFERHAQKQAMVQQRIDERAQLQDWVSKLKEEHKKIDDYEDKRKKDTFMENKQTAIFNLSKSATLNQRKRESREKEIQ